MAVSPKPPARLDGPLPLRVIFPLLFVGVYLAHGALLRLPYYWDEAGYYIPAAYDFFRTGDPIPSTTLANAHPPLPSLYLALWWKSAYTPAVTRTAMCFMTAIALLAVYRLAMLLSGRQRVAAVTTVLTALYPVWFAQSTLAHADMFAAAATLWGLAFLFAGRDRALNLWTAVACFTVAAWCKETAIVTPVAISAWEMFLGQRSGKLREHLRAASALLVAPVSLLAWYGYYHHRTGFFFGNPEFLRYNATANLSSLRILLALGHRILHLFAHMNMFVPVLCMIAATLLLPPLTENNGKLRPRIVPAQQAVLLVVIVANLLFFSVMGGALLTRYLLPLYPLVLLLCVSTFYRRIPLWWSIALLSGTAFVIGIFVDPPYKFAPEDNLHYADVVRLHQQAIRQIVTHYPGSTILTAWPGSDELSKPELGYVKKPLPVVVVTNFSLPEIQRAAQENGDYTVSFAFSTKYDPASPFGNAKPLSWPGLQARNEVFETRFFDFHRDLPPGAIARILDGKVVWREDRKGEWAAVLHFNRPQVAGLESLREP